MPDMQLILNLAKHAAFILGAAIILGEISHITNMGINKNSIKSKGFLICFFGFLGILGTYSGNQIFDSFANLRAMSVITAGLYAGPVVGTGAGLVAGLHRIWIDPWGFSTIPCSLATVVQGMAAGFLSLKLGRYSRDWRTAALICFIFEGAHMLMVLALSHNYAEAIDLLKIIALPMMIANPMGAALFIHLIKVVFEKKEKRESIQARNVLAIANETVGYLRSGLNMTSAKKTTEIIFERLTVAAVSITDTTIVLAHIGEGSDHHLPGKKILTKATKDVLIKGKPIFHTSYKHIGCNVPGCPFVSAIIIPLKKKDHIIGTLKLYGSQKIFLDQIKFKIAQGLTELFSTQFELEDLQTKEQLLAHTKIRHLQAQINPHFLFNSLNTIASFCRTRPRKARELILDLSSYMRKNLDSSRGFVPLSDELEQIKSYLAIEKARFGDRIEVKLDVSRKSLNWPIPPLIIQPLVENAIKHGILSCETGGMVEIKTTVKRGMLEISIKDDGSGIDQEQLESILMVRDMDSHRGGVGLINTNLRMVQIYGPEHSLKINSKIGIGTRIRTRIPHVKIEKPSGASLQH